MDKAKKEKRELLIELPPEALEKLNKQAREQEKTPEQLAAEAIEQLILQHSC